MNREFKIKVAEKTTSDGKKKFLTYKTTSKNGRLIDVKFRQTCGSAPTTNCIVIVDEDKCHLNTSNEYPVLWIEEIVEIKSIAEASAESNRKRLNDFFGE